MESAPFQVAVAEAKIEELRERLRATRWLPEVPGSEWLYGVDRSFLRELCDYWADGFDWRAAERLLNAFPQYRTPLDCPNGETLEIHFIQRAVRGPTRSRC